MDTVAAEQMPYDRLRSSDDMLLSLLDADEAARHQGARLVGISNLRFCAWAFIALSVLDFYLTWLMVGKWGIATEVNPLAADVLHHAGWVGLSLFKFAVTAFVVVLIQAVARRNLRSARILFRTGVIALSLVVGYSSVQLLANVDAIHSLASHSDRKEVLHQRERVSRRFSRRADMAAEKILSGECSLACAVEELYLFSSRTVPRGADYLRGGVYTDFNEETTIAANLICRVGHRINHDPVRARRLFHSLVIDFQRYHNTLPWTFEIAFFPKKQSFHSNDRYPQQEDDPPASPECWFLTYRAGE